MVHVKNILKKKKSHMCVCVCVCVCVYVISIPQNTFSSPTSSSHWTLSGSGTGTLHPYPQELAEGLDLVKD